MKKLIGESVERYNNKRPHWSCLLLAPEQMYNQDKLNILTYKNEKSRRGSIWILTMFVI